MQLDLILKDITDKYVRENFFRLRKFIGQQPIFDGNFKLFDVLIPIKSSKYKIAHGLSFIPEDIIFLSCDGDYNFAFLYSDFDANNIYLNTHGPVRIRFLAGRLDDINPQAVPPPSYVAPGNVIAPSSPGFVYGAVNAQSAGFWLTSEGIPSNVVGIPVLFSDAEVTLAAVGSQVEASYTIGIYQHEGAGINLTQLSTFNVISGGNKRIPLAVPVTSTSPNVQLACRLESGSTQNLKVSLILEGSAA